MSLIICHQRVSFQHDVVLCLIACCLPQGDVFFYYGLRNFHQNLRRYMDSRDDAQMVGRKNNLKVLDVSFSPLLFALLFHALSSSLPLTD